MKTYLEIITGADNVTRLFVNVDMGNLGTQSYPVMTFMRPLRDETNIALAHCKATAQEWEHTAQGYSDSMVTYRAEAEQLRARLKEAADSVCAHHCKRHHQNQINHSPLCDRINGREIKRQTDADRERADKVWADRVARYRTPEEGEAAVGALLGESMGGKRMDFDSFVANVRLRAENTVNGMPWSGTYEGHRVTHETDTHYIIATKNGDMHFRAGEVIVTLGDDVWIVPASDTGIAPQTSGTDEANVSYIGECTPAAADQPVKWLPAWTVPSAAASTPSAPQNAPCVNWQEIAEANGREVAMLSRQLRAAAAGEGWRCFHCNTTYYVYDDALEHFGKSSGDTPKCRAAAPASSFTDIEL